MLQIIDFGVSEILDPHKKYNDMVGTIHYLPPESCTTRSAEDLKKGDLWSLGVIAYILVCFHPISSLNPKKRQNIHHINSHDLFSYMISLTV